MGNSSKNAAKAAQKNAAASAAHDLVNELVSDDTNSKTISALIEDAAIKGVVIDGTDPYSNFDSLERESEILTSLEALRKRGVSAILIALGKAWQNRKEFRALREELRRIARSQCKTEWQLIEEAMTTIEDLTAIKDGLSRISYMVGYMKPRKDNPSRKQIRVRIGDKVYTVLASKVEAVKASDMTKEKKVAAIIEAATKISELDIVEF
jgi:hypothetical protein